MLLSHSNHFLKSSLQTSKEKVSRVSVITSSISPHLEKVNPSVIFIISLVVSTQNMKWERLPINQCLEEVEEMKKAPTRTLDTLILWRILEILQVDGALQQEHQSQSPNLKGTKFLHCFEINVPWKIFKISGVHLVYDDWGYKNQNSFYS